MAALPHYRSPHPARAVLAMRGITNRALADALGYCEGWTCRVLRGRDAASPEFKRRLAAYLGEPADELFHPEDQDLHRRGHVLWETGR